MDEKERRWGAAWRADYTVRLALITILAAIRRLFVKDYPRRSLLRVWSVANA